MPDTMIKICGIRSPEMAEKAAQAGVNFIGLVFHPSSPRYVNIHEATAISHAAKKAGAEPVAVFVNHDASEMQNICEVTNIHMVQLHGDLARAEHRLLPADYRRIYVQSVSSNGKLKLDDELRHLDSDRDLLLIDHEAPGAGNVIHSMLSSCDLPFIWLLAGGLTSSTVADVIHRLHPDGVDVSSGVEVSRGNKDFFLIQQFIHSARGQHAS